jgi:hypothetical protein
MFACGGQEADRTKLFLDLWRVLAELRSLLPSEVPGSDKAVFSS